MPISSEMDRRNALIGGGHPKGTKGLKTLLKEAVKKQFDQRVYKITDKIFIAQATLALGQTFLYKIEKEFVPVGKFGNKKAYYKNLLPKIVNTQEEIENYLQNSVDKANGDIEDTSDPAATFYYLTAKEPSNLALDSLLNRAFGKPKESLDVSGEVKFSLKDLARRRLQMNEQKVIDVVPLAIENDADNVSTQEV